MLYKIKNLLRPTKKSKLSHLKSGELAEIRARQFMEEKEYKTIDTNVHSRFGEIDIIMIKDKELVFIEVRKRSTSSYGNAAQSVHIYKQRKIIHAARYFLQKNPEFTKFNARFDVITIDNLQNNLQWHPCAFLMESHCE